MRIFTMFRFFNGYLARLSWCFHRSPLEIPSETTGYPWEFHGDPMQAL